ncbi:hypothetical protein CHU98_g12209, partial [Xylaria longipes]
MHIPFEKVESGERMESNEESLIMAIPFKAMFGTVCALSAALTTTLSLIRLRMSTPSSALTESNATRYDLRSMLSFSPAASPLDTLQARCFVNRRYEPPRPLRVTTAAKAPTYWKDLRQDDTAGRTVLQGSRAGSWPIEERYGHVYMLIRTRPSLKLRWTSIAIMAEHKIVVFAGDHCGPEVIAEAIKVIKTVEELSPTAGKFNLQDHLLGGCSIDQTGTPLTDEALTAAKAADAVLLGAIG